LQHVRANVPHSAGNVAKYIPQLAKANPETFAAAVCSVDGEFFSFGDDRLAFSIQSCVKPFTYLMACSELGVSTVHQYVGREPSGQAFNSFSLTNDTPPLPFNPMINSGAIAVCNLIGQKDCLSSADRFERLEQTIHTLATDGGSKDVHAGFDNTIFMSERDTGFTNYALAHFMRSKYDTSKEFTRNISARTVEDNLQLYFQVIPRASLSPAAECVVGCTAGYRRVRYCRRVRSRWTSDLLPYSPPHSLPVGFLPSASKGALSKSTSAVQSS
jgi:glutaminase